MRDGQGLGGRDGQNLGYGGGQSGEVELDHGLEED